MVHVIGLHWDYRELGIKRSRSDISPSVRILHKGRYSTAVCLYFFWTTVDSLAFLFVVMVIEKGNVFSLQQLL